MIDFDVVAAIDEDRGLGKAGQLPWRLSADMARFKALTLEPNAGAPRDNAVVMGRRTWESLPPRCRPLPGRLTVGVTRQRELALPEGVLGAPGFEPALGELAALERAGRVGRVFVIGGAEIFALALGLGACQRVHLTRVHGRFGCDVRFPALGPELELAYQSGPKAEGALRYHFELYVRTRPAPRA
jgi:dihydrofolate reductase/thymidylate synthase